MRRLLAFTAALLALAASLTAAGTAAAESVAWQAAYDGHQHGGDAFTSVVAAQNAVFAAGYTAASWANRSDMVLARYTPAGTRSWVRTWNGPASGADQCWALARDRRGGLCLAGSTAGHGGDAVVVEFGANGRLRWWRRYDSGARWQDTARFVRPLTTADAVYVVVESRSGTEWRTRVLRYSLRGRRDWVVRLAPGSRVTGVTTDARDDLYVSGWSATTTGSEGLLASFARDGSQRWTVGLPGGDAFARTTSIAAGGGGIVSTLCASDGPTGLGRASVLSSVSAPFTELWDTPVATALPHELNAVAGADGGGAVAVGRLRDGESDLGFAVAVDAAGAAGAPLVWSAAGGCSGDLVTAASGGAWVAGRAGYTFSLLHLSPAPALAWRYDFTARPSARALALAAAPDGGAYVAGWSRAMGAGADAVLLRVTP